MRSQQLKRPVVGCRDPLAEGTREEVGREAHVGDPAGGHPGENSNGLIDGTCAVIDSGKEVAVEIDHA